MHNMLLHPILSYGVYPLLVIVLGNLIWRRLNRPNSVYATLEYSRLIVPPAIASDIERMLKQAEEYVSQRSTIISQQADILGDFVNTVARADGQVPTSDAASAIAQVKNQLRDLTRRTLWFDDLGQYVLIRPVVVTLDVERVPRVIWFGEIVNKKGEVARNVRLEVPNARYAAVQRPGNEEQFNQVTEVIEIGNIQATESIRVTAWCWTIGEYSKYNRDRMVLRHDGGVGRVQLRIPLGSRWEIAAAVVDFLKSGGFVLVALLILWIASAILAESAPRRSVPSVPSSDDGAQTANEVNG